MAAQQTPDSISFVCPRCNKQLRAPQSLAGKNVQCPGCKTPIPIPAGQAVAPAESAVKPITQRIDVPVALARPASTVGVKTGASSKMAAASPSRLGLRPSKLKIFASRQDGQEDISAQPKSKKKLFMMVGGGIALVAVIVVIALIMSNQSQKKEDQLKKDREAIKLQREEEAKQTQAENAKEALAEIEQTEKVTPLDYKGHLKKITEKEEIVKGTPSEAVLNAKKDEIKQKREILSAVKRVTDDFDKTPDYNNALERYGKLKDDAKAMINPEILVAEIERLESVVRETRTKEVDKELAALSSKVDEELTKNAFQKARESYAKIPDHLKDLPEAKEGIAKLKERIMLAETAYRKKRLEWQSLFDGSTISGWDLRGCDWEVKDDCLVLTNKQSSTGVALTGESDWQDITFNMAFKILQGAVTVVLRIDVTKPANNIEVPLTRKFGDAWDSLAIELKEGAVTYKQGNAAEKTIDLPEDVPPRGKIAIILRGGDSIIIKEIKAKLIE